MAALRSSAFCCERCRTFLSSWRWSSVPTNSPLTVFIWLSSICVWWREFLLWRRLERTFSSRSSTAASDKNSCLLTRTVVYTTNTKKTLKYAVCGTDPCSPGSLCSLNSVLSSYPAGPLSAAASSPSLPARQLWCRCPAEFSVAPAPLGSAHHDSCWVQRIWTAWPKTKHQDREQAGAQQPVAFLRTQEEDEVSEIIQHLK